MLTRHENASTLRLPRLDRRVRASIGGTAFEAILRDARTLAIEGVACSLDPGVRFPLLVEDETEGTARLQTVAEVVGVSAAENRVILSLDEPVTVGAVDETAPPAQPAAAPGRAFAQTWIRWRRRTKVGIFAGVWALIGSATIAYAGTLLYANLVRLEIDSAVITGALEPLQASATGTLVAVAVRSGDEIGAGARLFVVQDPEVERQVSMASLRLERTRQELRLRERELEAERARRDDYRLVARAEIERLRAEIAGLEQQLENARARVARYTELYAKGYASRQRLEDAVNEQADLTSRLTRVRIVERERVALLPAIEAGRHYDGAQLVGKLSELEAMSARALAEVEIAAEELGVWMSRRAPAAVSSPGPGRVVRLLRGEGATVKQGDTVAVFQPAGRRVVHAFLTQEEVVRIAVGDEATVFVPALRAHAPARVVGVERAAGYLDDVESRYTWRSARDGGARATDRDRTARVTLSFSTETDPAALERLEPGLPAIVSFRRQSTNTVLGGFVPMPVRTADRP